jgi:hypothetical protein
VVGAELFDVAAVEIVVSHDASSFATMPFATMPFASMPFASMPFATMP